jgi:hypothetical protein
MLKMHNFSIVLNATKAERTQVVAEGKGDVGAGE